MLFIAWIVEHFQLSSLSTSAESYASFSQFGLQYLQQAINFILPEGHAFVKEWFLMKWWHVLIVSLTYPFLIGNIRVYRFENHPKPIYAFSSINLIFTVFSVIVYVYILFEIVMYYISEGFLVCHPFPSETPNFKMATVLWFFHVSRLFFDLMNTIQSTLTKTVTDLKSDQNINEIRFTLTHFFSWWLILLYYPGGEVIYPVATVCLFHLGTLACAFSQGKHIKLKMFLWIVLVVMNFARLGINLWTGCPFPAAILAISPPYDINSSVHMMLFYFVGWFPAGFLLHYMLYGRGALCTWWTAFVFLVTAHWPHGHSEEKRSTMIGLTDFEESSKKKKEAKKRKNGLEILKAIAQPPQPKEAKPEIPMEQLQHQLSKINFSTFNPSLRKCSYFICNEYEKVVKSFKICERCRAPYCSKECQVKDWESGNHRIFCKQKAKLLIAAANKNKA